MNELQTLTRTILFSQAGRFSCEAEKSIAFGRAYIFLRLLASKAWEGHELVRKRILSNRDVRDLLTDLPPDAAEALDRCKRRIGQENVLNRLRNDHGFHYPSDELIDSAFAEIPDEEALEFFVSEDGDANFFGASELIFSVATAQAASGDGLAARFGALQDELLLASRDLSIVLSHVMATILQTIPDPTGLAEKSIEAPWTGEVSIPAISKKSRRN